MTTQLDLGTSLKEMGADGGVVSVTIGPKFLERFSEHLYSSPNKAFEELVSNSWDADATVTHVQVSGDLASPEAAVWIIDNGFSMDFGGLQALWAVAESHKREGPTPSGRNAIGKFGLGKLATYLLANELTYVCCSADGIIRALSIDYRAIDRQSGLSIPQIDLGVRELSRVDLDAVLKPYSGSAEMLTLIDERVPRGEAGYDDEFGGPPDVPPVESSTWTLAILTSLKPTGQKMQVGQIRRMLRASLPLGRSLSILFNGEALTSTKLDDTVAEEWVIGPGLGITSVEIPEGGTASVSEVHEPFPHVLIEGVPGPVTGYVRLYRDKISGGKSDELLPSNGFRVNILGRLIKPTDHYFGLHNLNHSVWAKFRATVRADGLDTFLAVNRETFAEGDELKAFRAFLHALFNKGRVRHDAMIEDAWRRAGQRFAREWSAVPLEPLRRVVEDGLQSPIGLPDFVNASGVADKSALVEAWPKAAGEGLIDDVVLEEGGPDDPLVRYDLARRSVVVNISHPFAKGHSSTEEERLLLRDLALVEVLGSAYLIDAGVSPSQLTEAAHYRDLLQRLLSRMNRRTALEVARILITAGSDEKGLEELTGDALESLGFDVSRKGQSGEPEGVARAFVTPSAADRSTYSFTYDAKSSIGRVQAKDVNTAGLKRHRLKHSADFTLVVAPDYEIGVALPEQCLSDKVTPMRVAALARLLMLAGARGPIPMPRLRSLFEWHHPDDVERWVEALEAEQMAVPHLSLGIVLRVLEDIGYTGPNAVTCSVIADRIEIMTKAQLKPRRTDVQTVLSGLAVIAPSLVSINGDDVFLSTSPTKMRELLIAQLQSLPKEYRYGLDADIERPANIVELPARGARRSTAGRSSRR